MPWSSQNGGGGWKSSGGGPWGQGPGHGGGGKGGSDGPNPPDIEELLRRSQDRLKKAMPGGPKGSPLMGGGLPFALVIIAAVAFAAFYAFTVKINADEQGVVLRFGKFERQLPPGLHLRWPYPIEEVLKPKVTREKQLSVGIYRSTSSRFGQTTGGDIPAESLMLTGDSNIVDIDFDIFWRIQSAEKYLFNVRNPELTVKAVGESAMREIVGKSKIQPLMTKDRVPTELAVKKLMQETLDKYDAGIVITRVKLTKVDPPAQVIDAFRDVQAAEADQKTTINQALVYANKILEEAQGQVDKILASARAYEKQTIAEATGEAARFEKIYAEYKKAPEITRQRMFLETMERVFGKMDKIIIDSKGSGTGGVVPYLPLSELMKRKQAGGQ